MSREEFIEAVKTARHSLDSAIDGVYASHYIDKPSGLDFAVWEYARKAMREALEEWATEAIEEADEYV